MKLLTILLSFFVTTAAFALPEGGVVCKNNDHANDSFMQVDLVDNQATFHFWESSYDSIQVTAAGANAFAIVEEKVLGSGEGMTWVSIFSAFMVYNYVDNTLAVTTSFDDGQYTRHQILKCN